MSSIPPQIPPQPDEVRTHLATLHARFLSLQSSSSRRIGPAMAFFEPFLRRSPTLSFVRCTVCVPGPVPRAVADSVKMELSKAARSDGGAAISKGKVSRIRGFVARSSRTAAGGTSSLFNHAHRSHPTLLAALRELIDRDMPPVRGRSLRVAAGRAGKRRRKTTARPGLLARGIPRAARPSPPTLRLAAASACGLLPPGIITGTWVRDILRDGMTSISRSEMIHSVWPYLREEVKARVVSRLAAVPGVGLTVDEWTVAGRGSRVWAVNAHFVDAAWKLGTVNLGLAGGVVRGATAVVDVRRALDSFGLRDRVFGVVTGSDVGVLIDGRLHELIGECFRGNCLFSAVATAAHRVCTGEMYGSEQTLVLHGESDASLESTVGVVARCLAIMRENLSSDVARSAGMGVSEAAQEIGQSSIGDVGAEVQTSTTLHSAAAVQGSAATTNAVAGAAGVSGAGSSTPTGGIQELIADASAVDSSAVTAAAARAAAAAAAANEAREATATVSDVPHPTAPPAFPKPWLRGCFLSLLSEWENLLVMSDAVHAFGEDQLQPMREMLTDEHWVIVRAVTKTLGLVREYADQKQGWCMLPDALMKLINLVCGICDRLTEIEMLADQSIITSSQYSSLRQYMTEFLRSHQIRQEDADGSTPVITILEGYLLNSLLDTLYPLIQPLIEYVPKQSYCIMALALDPRYGSLASLISVNKKLIQGSRLMFEKEFPGDDSEGSDERVRKRVLSMLSRYDHEVIVPVMLALNSKNASGSPDEPLQQKLGQDAEEGLFAETFEPTEDWKSRQHLDAELAKFRSYKKNIPRSASAAECLSWWESNAELFPNISTLFRKVVGVPSSQVPLDRILTMAGPKMKIARRRIGRGGLEDLIFLHENLTHDMFADILGMPRIKMGTCESEERGELFDDDSLMETAPELFAFE